MFDIIDVLSNALSVARTRINTLSSNIANAETTRTTEGGPYKRLDVVQVAQTMQSGFSSVLDKMSLAKPAVMAVVQDKNEPRKVYQPGHPDANPEGYVSYPNINVVSEMTNLMTASRLYQANTVAIESARQMQQQALAISTRS